MKTIIISTSTAEHLVPLMAKKMRGARFVLLNRRGNERWYFPDGEIYARLGDVEKIKNKRVIVMHAGMPNPNAGLVELELILQILKTNGIKAEVFFTYFPYGMQDDVFKDGETNAARDLLDKLVNYYRIKKIYVIDPHFGKRDWAKSYPLLVISAVPLLIEKARKDYKKDLMVLSPDKGGKRRTGITAIRKKRVDVFQVKFFAPDIDVAGKVVGVVDDIVETGGTLVKFYETMRKAGAKKVVTLITHGVLRSGVARIKKIYSKVYLTNTIRQKEANVDASSLIVKALAD